MDRSRSNLRVEWFDPPLPSSDGGRAARRGGGATRSLLRSRPALLCAQWWAADNLLRAGDQLLLLHVIKEADYEQSEAILWESTGSRTRPPPPHDPISSSDPPLL